MKYIYSERTQKIIDTADNAITENTAHLLYQLKKQHGDDIKSILHDLHNNALRSALINTKVGIMSHAIPIGYEV